jgi:hypothetical protein
MPNKDKSTLKSEVESKIINKDFTTGQDAGQRLKDIIDSTPNIVEGIDPSNLIGTVPDERLNGTSPELKNVKTQEGPIYDVTHLQYGAGPEKSASQNKTAIQSAIDAAENTGGDVYIPRRSSAYEVEGLELKENVRLLSDGAGGATLKLPASPSSHLITLPSADISNIGVVNIEMDGGGTTTYDALHLDDCTRLQEAEFDLLYIHDFRRAYSGSQSDRNPFVTRCRLHNNEVGLYVNVNHPWVHSVDFRSNGTGLGGDPFDMTITESRFVANDVGVQPLDNGGVSSCVFNNCLFFKNADFDIELSNESSLIGGFLVPGSSTQDGIRVRGRKIVVSSPFFRNSAGSKYSGAGIDVKTKVGGSIIKGGSFGGVGTPVALNDVGDTRALNIYGLSARIDTDVSTIKNSSFGPMRGCRISGITTQVNVDPTVPVFDLGEHDGLVFTGNNIYGESGSGTWIKGTLNNSIVKNNITRRIETRDITTDAETVVADNIETSTV